MDRNSFLKFIEKSRNLVILDLIVGFPFLALPLFIHLPYRVNIFLTWEGAYRLYLGQVPYEDFGIPLGFGFWLIPALFFKLFGPTFLSLIKAQVFINLISMISLRGILYTLKIKPVVVSLTLLVFSLTYVIYNFWPWYNHSVVVFELVALYFATSFNDSKTRTGYYARLFLTGVFSFITFYTKQDVGGICFLLCLFIVSYISLLEKTFKPIGVYLLAFGISASLLILPFIHHDFFYWFNYGQPPHNSRVSISQLLDLLFSHSALEKIYLAILLGGIMLHVSSFVQFFKDQKLFLITTICVALITQSIITRVSSPLPTDHMNYFHAFGFIGITLFLPWEKWSLSYKHLLTVLLCLIVTFSSGFWKYVSGVLKLKNDEIVSVQKVSKPWVNGSTKTLKHVMIPSETEQGIKNIMSLPFAHKEGLKVLNMSELTFLAYEMNYTPLTNQPLWYHLNIGMFQKEVDEINKKVTSGYYDLVLFEDIPSLNNFYPYEIRNQLKKKYHHINTFLAPRKLEDSTIEVYINPDLTREYNLKFESTGVSN